MIIRKLTILFAVLIFICIVVLSAYGVVQFCTYKERMLLVENSSNQITELKDKCNKLSLEIEVLELCLKWEGILKPILSSLEKAELNAIQEKIRQRIQNEFSDG